MHYTPKHPINKALFYWLLTCWIMVFCMVLLGGITRLTDSGLSMVEWKLQLHFLPPLSLAEWERVFDLYKTSPEAIKVNAWMTLADYKRIYLFEWFHRFWGQFMGLVFLLPLLYFTFKAPISVKYKCRLWVIFVLGGLQGFLGWFMVKSGLVNDPHVSHFRLAAHLSMAILLLLFLVYEMFQFVNFESTTQRSKPYLKWLYVMFALCCLTILWGAFTAGLDAGLIYNNFPLMNDHFLPDELRGTGQVSEIVLTTTGGVQFMHRMLAYITFGGLLSLSILLIKVNRLKLAYLVLTLVSVQVVLGIVTLLYQVPILAAMLHQGNAILLINALFLLILQIRVHKA